jgi:hypothetical protein
MGRGRLGCPGATFRLYDILQNDQEADSLEKFSLPARGVFDFLKDEVTHLFQFCGCALVADKEWAVSGNFRALLTSLTPDTDSNWDNQ